MPKAIVSFVRTYIRPPPELETTPQQGLGSAVAGAESTGICVLGSTGSIGKQTLQIVDALRGRFRVASLTARANADELIRQALRYRPDVVGIADPAAATRVGAALAGTGIEVVSGPRASEEVAARDCAGIVVAAIVGFAGLRPVMAALERGVTVALANKETLVAAGELVTGTIARSGGRLVPVDSEHSAIFQCLQGESPASVRRLVLTASGGPFLDRALDTLDSITVAEALAHPNWSMGDKITVDSATMMNKGLEVIEARWLFDVPATDIDVLVHPQSIVHSLVEFVDGSTKAQLGVPDMRVPIQYALTYPERVETDNPRIDWSMVARLDFRDPEPQRFPCLGLAYEALRAGGTAPAALNAANEQAVAQFLAGAIRYVDIASVIEHAVAAIPYGDRPDLQTLVEVDEEARRRVTEHRQKVHH